MPTASARVQRVELHAASHAAVLDGLDPGRLDPAAKASALRGIGPVAGNAAVASLVARVQTNMAQDPPGESARSAGSAAVGRSATRER